MAQPESQSHMTAPIAVATPPVRRRRRSPWHGQPAALVSAIFLIAVVGACIAAPLLAPYGPAATDFAHAGAGPSAAHLLGTDNLGRDVLSRLLYGGQHTLSAVFVGLLVAAVVGCTLGLVAGFRSGWWDRTIGWLLDGLMALPSMILLLAVLAVFPHNTTAAMIAFGVMISAGLARVVRAAALSVRSEQYIDAARVAGVTEGGIILRHVSSKVMGPVIVQLTLLAAIFLLTETGLGFLGLGPQPPTPTWGSLVTDASSSIQIDPWLLVPTGGTVALMVLAFGLLGNGVRDVVAGRWSGGPNVTQRVRSAPPPLPPAPRRSAKLDRAADAPAVRDAPLLSVRGLTIEFDTSDGRQQVLRDVSFDIGAGDTVALVGESGSGKSVTAKAILGLLPGSATVTAGEVLLNGVPIAGAGVTPPPGIAGKRVAMISQAPMISLDPSLKIGALLTESVRRHTGRSSSASRARALELLGLVGIPEPAAVMRRYPHELSGGMAQRVGIARALSGEPELLLADEPTTALDVTVQADILDLLRQLQDDLGLAILLVTHDWGVVADIAHSCVVMYAGEVVETASADQIFHHPRHPYTRGLMDSNPHSAEPRERLAALPGRVLSPSEWPVGCHFANRCPFVIDRCTTRPIPLEPLAGARTSRCIRVDELEVAEAIDVR
jgi:peptide/nickel transport system permease protein